MGGVGEVAPRPPLRTTGFTLHLSITLTRNHSPVLMGLFQLWRDGSQGWTHVDQHSHEAPNTTCSLSLSLSPPHFLSFPLSPALSTSIYLSHCLFRVPPPLPPLSFASLSVCLYFHTAWSLHSFLTQALNLALSFTKAPAHSSTPNTEHISGLIIRKKRHALKPIAITCIDTAIQIKCRVYTCITNTRNSVLSSQRIISNC